MWSYNDRKVEIRKNPNMTRSKSSWSLSQNRSPRPIRPMLRHNPTRKCEWVKACGPHQGPSWNSSNKTPIGNPPWVEAKIEAWVEAWIEAQVVAPVTVDVRSDKVQIIEEYMFDVVSLPAYKIGKGPSDSQATKQLTEPHFLPKSKFFFCIREDHKRAGSQHPCVQKRPRWSPRQS